MSLSAPYSIKKVHYGTERDYQFTLNRQLTTMQEDAIFRDILGYRAVLVAICPRDFRLANESRYEKYEFYKDPYDLSLGKQTVYLRGNMGDIPRQSPTAFVHYACVAIVFQRHGIYYSLRILNKNNTSLTHISCNTICDYVRGQAPSTGQVSRHLPVYHPLDNNVGQAQNNNGEQTHLANDSRSLQKNNFIDIHSLSKNSHAEARSPQKNVLNNIHSLHKNSPAEIHPLQKNVTFSKPIEHPNRTKYHNHEINYDTQRQEIIKHALIQYNIDLSGETLIHYANMMNDGKNKTINAKWVIDYSYYICNLSEAAIDKLLRTYPSDDVVKCHQYRGNKIIIIPSYYNCKRRNYLKDNFTLTPSSELIAVNALKYFNCKDNLSFNHEISYMLGGRPAEIESTFILPWSINTGL